MYIGIMKLILKKLEVIGMILQTIKKIFNSTQNEKQSEAIVLDTKNDIDDAEAIIKSSLLFDEKWYKKEYELGEFVNAAQHYLEKGSKQGKNPSRFFNTQKYLKENPEVKIENINPLVHFEKTGCKKPEYQQWLQNIQNDILKDNPSCRENIEGGLLRLRITNACNAKCRYCGVRLGFGTEKEHEMEPKWYYEYCKPLYKKLNIVLITGGDAFVASESYNYMKFMCENYPQITLMTESNGIAFSEKYQKLASTYLFKTHFSINASNSDYFVKGCWEGAGGDKAFPKLMTNIHSYVNLLKENDRQCFSPSVSMVINKDNAEDVFEFIKTGLKLHAWYICFFFDYTENDMTSAYFRYPEISRNILKMLMEIERVLAGKVFLYFRLWLPLDEVEPLQKEVEEMPLADLKEKYQDLLELAKDRSVRTEFEQRNIWRKKLGKKQLSFDEDFAPTLRITKVASTDICFAPWKELDLYPDGRLDFCGWFERTLNLHDFLENDIVDWDKILNSFEYMSARKRMLQGNFRGCQDCCPMNSSKNPLVPVHTYGLERIEN